MLGIIIGIAAVLVVLIIGDGMKATVNSEMDDLGASTVSVSLDTLKTEKTFTREQLKTIESAMNGIYGISPSQDLWGNFVTDRKTFDASINCNGAAKVNAAGNKIIHGRYFSENDVDESKNVIVISQSTANKLFGYEMVVGNTVHVDFYGDEADFTIIGVREDTSMDKAYASFGDEPTLMGDVPFTSGLEANRMNPDETFTSFSIYMDKENKDQVLSSARSIVENVMGLRGENAVKIQSSAGFDQTTDTILNIITSVVAIIAAISLLVGGIGVMNIMTVSVTERTREIGIRKSLGARTGSILTQFLAEAAILTFTGGIIGIIAGLSIAFLICKIVDFTFMVNPVLVLVVVLISTSIGLFFGIYPARRAANLDPIEALRME
jgi:putative ABC transport system permease protein